MSKMIRDIKTIYPDHIPIEEVNDIVVEEIAIWHNLGKKLGSVEIECDGKELIIKSVEKSPIRRLRRITGYLSQIDSFNEGKRAELNDRVIQTLGQQARPL